MNAQMKKHLEAVIEAIVSADTVAAKESFHQYLSLKTQSLLSEESCDDDMDNAPPFKKKDEDKDEDKSDDKKKDDEKDDKKKDDKSDDKKKKDDKKKDEGDE